MNKSILVLSTLIFVSSCRGTNKTSSNSSEEIQKQEIVHVETSKQIIVNAENNIEDNSTETIKMIAESETKVIDEFSHALWNDLLQKHVSNNGNVNYKGFKANESELKIYFQLLSDNTPQASWTKVKKLAYWINAYNAFTIKLIIDKYPAKSIKDISSPWDQRFIELGDNSYTLNNIEHKILRKMNEPRIHFAIVCASISCPKLQNTAFEPANLEAQLTNATKEFLKDPARNNLAENNIKISKIFKWFSSDFKQNGSLVDFLNKYSEITISQDASKSYKDYDWNLNE